MNINSIEIRRFFDLLGAAFCGLSYSFFLWSDVFRFRYKVASELLLLPVFLFFGLAIYLAFYSFIWKFLNAKFIYGYFNFFLISVLSVTTVALLGFGLEYLLNGFPIVPPLRISGKEFLYEAILFYQLSSLPMAAFWFVGVLCSWKFSERKHLP